MIRRMILQGLLAALIVGGLAFAWQAYAQGEGAAATAASLGAALGHGLGEDD